MRHPLRAMPAPPARWRSRLAPSRRCRWPRHGKRRRPRAARSSAWPRRPCRGRAPWCSRRSRARLARASRAPVRRRPLRVLAVPTGSSAAPSPGADVAGVSPSLGADVGRGERSPGADVGGVSPVPAQMHMAVVSAEADRAAIEVRIGVARVEANHGGKVGDSLGVPGSTDGVASARVPEHTRVPIAFEHGVYVCARVRVDARG